MPGRVLVPLPDRDLDTTEVAVPWKVLTEAGWEVAFATSPRRSLVQLLAAQEVAA